MAASRYTGKPCSDCGKRKSDARQHLMRCHTCQRKKTAASRQASHGRMVKDKYGLTADDYRRLKAYQAGVCAVCARAKGTRRRLAVDHDHRCAEGHPAHLGCPRCVRGLLCAQCNLYLFGRYGDDPKQLSAMFERAIRYLNSPPWHDVRHTS